MSRGVTYTDLSPAARLRSVPPGDVALLGGFWRDRVDASRSRGLTQLHARLEEHGVVDNFRRRAGKAVPRRGFWFTDSDLYKWMEGAAWSLAAGDDGDGLGAQLDDAVEAVVAAQDPDGYLNTNFEREGRFPDLAWSHELYCAGHLIQAGIAHRRSCGRTDLLDVAVRFADFLAAEFGPGGREGRDRHPGVETALVELARETGQERYLDLARVLLERVDSADQAAPAELAGHAVCAMYFNCGLADLAAEIADETTRALLDRLWSDLVERRSYVTGGVGGRWVGESVGRPYELPAEGAYAETCAAVGEVQWAWRMLTLTGAARYADQLELTLHNAMLAGVSLDGDEWFYANPLAAFSDGAGELSPFIGETLALDIAGPLPLRRRPWRDVTCCPPNVTRLLASLPGYVYGTSDDGVWVHLYASSQVRAGGFDLSLDTLMPWEGSVALTVRSAPEEEASLHLRIPGWAGHASLEVNGESLPVGRRRSYREIRQRWAAGDRVTLELDPEVQVLEGNPRVAENRGSVALRRGPFVYCAEGFDNPDVELRDALLSPVGPSTVEWRPDLLGGVSLVRTRGEVPTEVWADLYRPLGPPSQTRAVELRLIPYYAWANRGLSPMTVWFGRPH